MVIVKDKINALNRAHAWESIVLRWSSLLLEAVSLGFRAKFWNWRAKAHQRVHQFFDVEALPVAQSWHGDCLCDVSAVVGVSSRGASGEHVGSEELPEHVLVLLLGRGLSVQALDRLGSSEAPKATFKLLEPEVWGLWNKHGLVLIMMVLLLLLLLSVLVTEQLGGC